MREKTKKDEIDRLNLEKMQAEQKAQSLQEDISRLEQRNATRREEIKKYETTVEIMEL